MPRYTGWIFFTLLVAAPCAAQTAAVTPTAPDFPRGRISGTMFGDYFYNLVGDPIHVYDASGADAGKQSIDAAGPITKDLNGTQFRRIYFQLDNDLTIRISTRFRLEVDGKSLTSDSKLGVNVKGAYLQAKSVYPRGDLFVGLIQTPIWENSEEFWQYRSIEKTVADFRGLGGSADLGFGLKGFADPNHHFGYSAMMGNGNGQKALVVSGSVRGEEIDRFKKLYFALPVRFTDLRVEPYADYEQARTNVAGNFDRATYKIFAGYEFRKVAVGAEGVERVNHRAGQLSQQPAGFSLFARGVATPTLAAFARFDHWQSNRNAKDRIDSQLYIAGIDWQPIKDVHVMPNVEATQYIRVGNPAGFPAHHDLQPRITFYYRFSRPQS
ncbi:MAG TPA: hypothetical protein VGK89_14845 [Candidatus Eisenbacteria bacterium]